MNWKSVIVLCCFVSAIIQCGVASDCGPRPLYEQQFELEYAMASQILMADVIWLSSDKSTYLVVVKQLFKGTCNVGDTIAGINFPYSDLAIDKIGEWLVYGKIEFATIVPNECGLTRSVQEPQNNRHFDFVPEPPPPPGHSQAEMDAVNSRNGARQDTYLARAHTTLLDEIASLKALQANRKND